MEDHGGGKNGQKVEKEGSGWTAGGIEDQDGAGRPCVWSPVAEEEGTRTHAPAGGRRADGERSRVMARVLRVAGGVASGR